MLWQDSFLKDLKAKNRNESQPFAEIVASYELLMLQCTKLYKKNQDLERENILLQHGNAATDVDVKANINIKRLEEKVQSLQEELTNKYRNAIDNSDATVKISVELQETREELKIKTNKLNDIQNKLNILLEKYNKDQQILKDNEESMDILRNELTRVRGMLEKSDAQVTTLIGENQDLINRLILEKNKMAEQLNAMMEGMSGHVRRNSKDDLAKRAEETITANVSHLVAKKGRSSKSYTGTILPTVLKQSISAHTGDIFAMKYSTDSSLLSSVGNEGIVKMWSTIDGSLKASLRGAEGALLFVDSKGIKCLAGGADKSARVWSIDTERVIHTLSGSREKIHCGVLSFDLNSAITGGADRCIRLWDLRSGYNVKTIGCRSTCHSIDVDNDGYTVVTGHRDCAVRLWDLREGSMTQEDTTIHTGLVSSTSFSSSNSGSMPSILTQSKDNSMCVLDGSSFKVVCSLTKPDMVFGSNWCSSGYSPNSLYCAAGSKQGKLFIFETMTKSLAKCLEGGHKGNISCVQWSNDGSQVASSSDDGVIALWI